MDMEFLGNVVFLAAAIVLMIIGERILRPKPSEFNGGVPTVKPDLSATVEEKRS